MSWIREVDEEAAEGPLADVYERVRGSRAKLSNIMRVQSLAPEAMAAHLDLYTSLLFRRGGLSRPERELIGVVVSRENGCRYCVLHHAAALEAWWKDGERVEQLREDPERVALTGRQRALCHYARKLTRTPAEMTEDDVEALRGAGLEDEEILQAAMIASYFNFVNRVADGLGVDAPADEVRGYRY